MRLVGEPSPEIARIDTSLDYRKAPVSERLHGAIVGDPLADYVGFPEIQRRILEEETSGQTEPSDLEQRIAANRERDEKRQADWLAERRAIVYGGSADLFRQEVASPSDI
jgi:hypothetical protein